MQEGFRVKAIDNKKLAIHRAKKFVNQFDFKNNAIKDNIEFEIKDGLNIENFNFDVIWISLNV